MDIVRPEKRTVGTRGPEDSPFVIVGEAPGKEEIKLGQPFVGPSGIVLQEALDLQDKNTYPEPYILNVIPHLVLSSKKKDKNAETYMQQLILENIDRVHQLIEKYPRKVILACGSVALQALLKNPNVKITKMRGKLQPSPLASIGIIPCVHPAFLLRGHGSFRQFKADIAKAIHFAGGGKPKEYELPTYEIIQSAHHMNWFLTQVEKHEGFVSGDSETSGFSHRMDHILCSGFTLDGKHVYVIQGRKSDYKPTLNFHPMLKRMWGNRQVKFNWQNGKFDVKFFHHEYNQFECRVDDDTMLMSYALDEQRGLHDLETIASDWLDSPDWKGELDKYKKKKESYDAIPYEVLFKYMCYDIANTHRLGEFLRPIVRANKMSEILYTKTLIPGSEYLAEIEKNGMMTDPQRIQENTESFSSSAAEQEEIIKAEAIKCGYGPINVNSPLQLSDLIYNTLGLKGKGSSRSTDADTIKHLPDHPVIVALRQYRKIAKGLSTYVTPAISHTQDDGRIHSTYLLHGSATGRLASRDPNLQNIPRDKNLRGQFVADEGKVFIECDLNQAELRSLAEMSRDPLLCAIYRDPDSVGLHEVVRAEVYGYPDDWSSSTLQYYMDRWYTNEVERVLEEQKMRAKNVNFGIVYGITAPSLAEQIEDTPIEAQRMLNAWANKFNVAWSFIQRCRQAPLLGKNLVTVFGHRKRVGIISPETLISTQNESANFPHQSTASTITLQAGIRLHRRLKEEYGVKIVNTVHDSIISEMNNDPEFYTMIAKMICNEMQQVPIDWGLSYVPFIADAKVGTRWGYTSKVKF